MKNLVQLFIAVFAFCCFNVYSNDNTSINPDLSNTAVILKAELDEQGVLVQPRGPGRFSYRCDCGIVVIERGLTPRGVPYVKQFFRAYGTFILRQLKLEEGAATDPSLIWTCEDICNGTAPSAN